MDAKTKVLSYLESNREFGAGIQLYQSLPGHNRATVAQLTRQGDNPKSRAQLHYDLARLAGIAERKLNIVLSKPVAVKPVVDVDDSAEGSNGSSVNNLIVDVVPEDYTELKKVAKALELKTPDKKKATLVAAVQQYIDSKKK